MMKNKIIVNKFGGGILNEKLIPFIEKRLRQQLSKGYQPIAVVSALPGITDFILLFLAKFKSTKSTEGKKNTAQLNQEFLKEMRQKHENAGSSLEKIFANLEKDLAAINRHNTTTISSQSEDAIIAYGERLSASLFASYLNTLDLNAQVFPAEEIPIITDENFKNANILFPISQKNVQKKFIGLRQKIAVIPGFTGKTEKGAITTLGRGGTDTTACFIGAAIKAEKIILWKDVSGVLSADPRIVKDAKTIPFINYQEALEAGKIIHDKAIQYAKMFDTPIEITSLADPRQKTVIRKQTKVKRSPRSEKGAKIVSYKKNLVLFIITDEYKKENDMLSIASQSFSRNNVDVILISNTRYSLQIVADNANGMAQRVLEEIQKEVSKVEAHGVSMVFLVGNFDVQDVNDFNSLLIKLKTDMEISAFLYKNCTRLESVIKTKKIEKIIQALHKKFIR